MFADVPQPNNPESITFYKDLDTFLLSFQLLNKPTSTRTQETRGKRKDAKNPLQHEQTQQTLCQEKEAWLSKTKYCMISV